MAEQKGTMPQSTAGLVRYFEDSKELIKLKPEHIVAVGAALVAVEIAFKLLL